MSGAVRGAASGRTPGYDATGNQRDLYDRRFVPYEIDEETMLADIDLEVGEPSSACESAERCSSRAQRYPGPLPARVGRSMTLTRALLVLLGGCGPSKDGEDGGGSDTGQGVVTETGDSAEDTGDSAEDTGDSAEETGDSAEDTGETGETNRGLLTWSGEANVDGTWEGHESILFVGDDGLGETWCEVRYPVLPVAERTDCVDCVLAFDVEFQAPETLISTLCAEVGYDDAAITALVGERRGYGFALDYLGHSNVLMFDDEGIWKAVAFVNWNESSATLSYAWERGYVEVQVPGT